MASGPYMIEGAEAIDYADPQAPPTYEADDLVLVRNPSWQRELDPIRPAYVDRIEIVPLPDRDAGAVDAAYRSEIDVTLDPMTSTARESVVSDPDLRPQLRESPYPTLFFIPLNLAQPPFDDVAVRRAVSAIIDREALVGTFDSDRGSAFVPVAHVFPEVAVGGLLQDYVPADSRAGTGNVARAQEHMSQSRYDSDGDGRCDGDDCAVVGERIGPTTDPALDAIGASLAELGIEITWTDEPLMGDPAEHIGLGAIFGWTADYPSGNDFAILMTQPGLPESLNVSLIGATPEQLEEWGYTASEVPSLDDKIASCRARGGSAAFACWAELDQLMTEQVVAWIPVASHFGAHVISDRIDRFEFAGSESEPALDRISLHPEAAP